MTKKDWSGVCATSDNRSQCGENCIIFPICLIKIPQTKLSEKLKEYGSHICVKGKGRCYDDKIPEENAVSILKEDIDKIFGEKK